jgi:hypothetical protein
MKRGGCSAICRLSGRIAVTLVSFRKRMAPSIPSSRTGASCCLSPDFQFELFL